MQHISAEAGNRSQIPIYPTTMLLLSAAWPVQSFPGCTPTTMHSPKTAPGIHPMSEICSEICAELTRPLWELTGHCSKLKCYSSWGLCWLFKKGWYLQGVTCPPLKYSAPCLTSERHLRQWTRETVVLGSKCRKHRHSFRECKVRASQLAPQNCNFAFLP